MSPFRSKAQEKMFREKVAKGEMTQAQFDEWAKDTDYSKLPTRLGTKDRKTIGKVKTVKVVK